MRSTKKIEKVFTCNEFYYYKRKWAKMKKKLSSKPKIQKISSIKICRRHKMVVIMTTPLLIFIVSPGMEHGTIDTYTSKSTHFHKEK